MLITDGEPIVPTLTKRELLCRRGFFPKELPPCFSSDSLDDEAILAVLSAWNGKRLAWCRADKFSSARKTHGRRILHIVNPLMYCHLADQIQTDWNTITNHLQGSPVAVGTLQISEGENRAVSFKDVGKNIINSAVDSLEYPVLLESDISRCYSSIYTHVFSWALNGKAVAKNNLRTDIPGSKLDKCVANLNEGQTKGLTVGQDTSRIIAEIVLASVDKELAMGMGSIPFKARRYIDDYKIFVDNIYNAQIGLVSLSKATMNYELEINSEKTKFNDPIVTFEATWVNPVRLSIDRALTGTATNLIAAFSEVLTLYQNAQDENLPRFFVESLYGLKFSKIDGAVLTSLLIKISEMSPNTLDTVVMLFLLIKRSSEAFSNLAVKKSFERILDSANKFGRDFEACWVLWGAKSLDISIDETILKGSLNTGSSAKRLLARYIAFESGLVGELAVSHITSDPVTSEFVSSADWLVAYESVRLKLFANGVDTSTFSAAFLQTDYKTLLDKHVKFFDETLFGEGALKQLYSISPRFKRAYERDMHEELLDSIWDEFDPSEEYN